MERGKNEGNEKIKFLVLHMKHKENKNTEEKTSPLQERVLELENQLSTLGMQLKEEKGKTLRAMADLENVRRREQEGRAQWGGMAVADFIKKILPSLLELQMGKEHSQDKALIGVVNKLFGALEKSGLTSINPKKNIPVDPQEHEVLLTAEGRKGCVVQTLEPGWKLYDIIICPAKISAAEAE